MTKHEAYRYLAAHDVDFVANLILCWRRNPAKKLHGAVRLIATGHTVTVGTTIDNLRIDGHAVPW